MKEVEVKAKVENLEELEKRLVDLGCEFSDSLLEEDMIFTNLKGDYAEFRTDVNFIRIRKRGDKITLTLKRPLTNEQDCIEKESEINNPKEVADMLELMDHKKALELKKRRKKTKYKGLEICLDSIEELGDFVEVEKLTNDEDSEKIQKELFDFLKSLGIDEKERVIRGYDTMVYLKREGRE